MALIVETAGGVGSTGMFNGMSIRYSIHTDVCICIYTYIYMYVCIYIEREREGEKERDRGRVKVNPWALLACSTVRGYNIYIYI